VETTAEATDEEVIDEEATATVTETAATPDATDTKEIIDSVAAEETRNRPKEWYGSLTGNREPDRVINLKEYTDRNTDVYAWIEIPGTDIDYPIAYCDDAVDPFWFTHDIDGNPSESGMIITDSMNAVDLSDPETLIYGQSPDDGTMFAQLSRFKDDDFFGKHDTVNIYINDAELVYRIYACYTGSNEHILINHDFTDPIQFMRFFDSIEEVRDLSKNIRQEAKPMIGDHAIALVTHCGDDSKRLFVHAKLTEVRY
jgi:sortase B